MNPTSVEIDMDWDELMQACMRLEHWTYIACFWWIVSNGVSDS